MFGTDKVSVRYDILATVIWTTIVINHDLTKKFIQEEPRHHSQDSVRSDPVPFLRYQNGFLNSSKR
jgi:hypothetical protein